MKQGQKKILFLVTKSNMGGAQRYVFDLAVHLPVDDFEPIVAFGNAQGSTGPGALLQKLTQSNIRTAYLPSLTRDINNSEWSTFRSIYSLLRIEKPDVLHLNSSKAGGLGALAGRCASIKKIIFTAHGWPFFEKRNLLVRTAIFLASYCTVLLSHTTICICETDAHAFDHLPFARRKIRVIPNGIEAEPLLYTRADVCNRLHITTPDDTVWIASVSELTANKNISLALKVVTAALKQNPNLFYVVIGDGEQREALIKYANDLGLSNKVHFAGQLADAPRYLSAFDMLFLPSQKEGLPYVTLEAGSAGVPVVASYVGGIPEIVTDGVSGFLRDSHDAEGFTEALVTLSNSEEKRHQFGTELQKTVTEKYSLARMIHETEELYRNL